MRYRSIRCKVVSIFVFVCAVTMRMALSTSLRSVHVSETNGEYVSLVCVESDHGRFADVGS